MSGRGALIARLGTVNRWLFIGIAVIVIGFAVCIPNTRAGQFIYTSSIPGRAFTHVVIDPNNPHVVYAAGNDGAFNSYIFKSADSGASWVIVNNGIGPMAVFALAISQANPQILYLGGYDFAHRSIALYQTTDGAGKWSRVAQNLGDNSVQAIALDPTDSNVSYLGLSHGLATSDDGVSWRLLPTIGQSGVFSLAMDRAQPPALFAGMPNSDSSPGLVKSTDGGLTWTNANNGLPGGNVYFLVPDPTNSGVLYSALSFAPNQQFSLCKSTDGGQNWIVTREMGPITSLIVDPLNGANVYYSQPETAWRSGDGGFSFDRIYSPGGGGLALDTLNPQTIYAGGTDQLASYTFPLSQAVTQTPVPLPTVTPSPFHGSVSFPQTGHTVSGRWLAFLKTHGDVDNLGYPRTEVIADSINIGQPVQYFQRTVLEYHPEATPGNQMQRRLLGDILYPGIDPPTDPIAKRPPGDAVYFSNSPGRGFGHFVANVAPDGSPTLFKQYFDTHGKEDAFGYPKEEAKQRILTDGKAHWTQRFQAAVFEYHQENDRDGLNANGVPYRNFRVELELLGDEYIAKNHLGYK